MEDQNTALTSGVQKYPVEDGAPNLKAEPRAHFAFAEGLKLVIPVMIDPMPPVTFEAGFPDPWSSLRRRLEGLRILAPSASFDVARMHLLVRAHVRELRQTEDEKTRSELFQAIQDWCVDFAQRWEHEPDPAVTRNQRYVQ